MVDPTAGPWEAKKNEKGFTILGAFEEGPHFKDHDIGLRGPRRRVVAEVYGIDAEGEVNARLIVAASPGAEQKEVPDAPDSVEEQDG